MLVVALSLVLLIGMAALAIDGGFLLVEKREAQNAADQAALAAAWVACSGGDATAAADASVAKNGYTPAHLTLTALGGDEYEAIVATTVDHHFAPVIGFDSSTVRALAVGLCVPAGGSGPVTTALWANYWFRTAPEDGPIIGFEPEYFGSVFANGAYCTSPNPTPPGPPCSDPIYSHTEGYSLYNTITNVPWGGDVQCTFAGCDKGFDTAVPPLTPTTVPHQPTLPVQIDFSEYAPGGVRSGDAYWGAGNYFWHPSPPNGVLHLNCSSPDGAYVVNGNVHLEGACGAVPGGPHKNISIFASGWIQIEDTAIEPFNAALEGIVLASWSTAAPYEPVVDGYGQGIGHLDEWCQETTSPSSHRTAAICHHAESNEVLGFEYAPYGHCRHADDDNFLYGAMLCESITAIPEESIIAFDETFISQYLIPAVYISQ